MSISKEIEPLIRSNILSLKPYSSARSEHVYDTGIFLDANENPYESGLNRYPDPYQRELKQVISNSRSVAIEKIFIGNGSDEAIDLIIRLFCEPGKDRILIPDPTYGMYEVSAGINQVEVDRCPLTENFEIDTDRFITALSPDTKIIFLCSPNNPTGNLLNAEDIKTILRRFNGVVVIDEAYIDFSQSASWLRDLENWPRLIVLQTLSKAWGLAGIRLGMAFAHPVIIDFLNRIKPPYNISSPVQKIAIQAITEDEGSIMGDLSEIISERDRLITNLNLLNDVYKVFPSEANFVLVRIRHAEDKYRKLIEKGVLVRNRSKLTHCEECLRITVGTPAENQVLMRELKLLEQ